MFKLKFDFVMQRMPVIKRKADAVSYPQVEDVGESTLKTIFSTTEMEVKEGKWIL